MLSELMVNVVRADGEFKSDLLSTFGHCICFEMYSSYSILYVIMFNVLFLLYFRF